MTRTIFFAVLGLIITVAVGVLAVALLAGQASISVLDPDAVSNTPPAVIAVPTTATDILPTLTATVEVAATEPTGVPAAATVTAPTVPSATTVAVANTDVRYVLARTDLNIRSGPGTTYRVVGWLARGQTAGVTGISSDGGWWRVICPDGSTGSCWVSAGIQYTQAATSPGSTPAATSAPTTCTDRAALIADVTVPDGTQFPPNTGFNKIWRLKNTGTCTWDGHYGLVQAGGHPLGAVGSYFPLRDPVFPGQSADLAINMVSPGTPDSYQSDWKLQNSHGQFFGVGRNNGPFWVKIVVVPGPNTTISGVVYEDANENGVYDSGEKLLADREVQLIYATACHVLQSSVATTRSDSNGRYTFSGRYSGTFCVGLSGAGGLDDVVGVELIAGETRNNVNLHAQLPSGSISGFLWNDYCHVGPDGAISGGDCVPDGTGSYRADGAPQPTEGTIAGASVLIWGGSCPGNSNPLTTIVTDRGGGYFFGNLVPGTYCVSIRATAPENAPLLLPGDWTYPAPGVGYQQISLQTNANARLVNFGWDYQFQ